MMAMACVGALMGCTSPVAGHRVSSRSTRAGSLYRLHDPYPKRRPERAAVHRRDVRAGADLEPSILAMVRPGQSRRGDRDGSGSSRRTDVAVVRVRRDRQRSDSRAFPTATGVRGTCDLRPGVVLLGSAASPASPDTRAVCDGNRVSTLAYAIRRPVRPNRAHTPRVQQHRRLSAPSTLSLFRARVRLLATRSAANPTQQRSCAPSPKR